MLLFILLIGKNAYSACAATTRSWVANAGTTAWNTNTNWSGNNVPNTNTENALIIADWTIPQYPANNYTLSCFEIQSGSMNGGTGTNTLTLQGDYFRNLVPGSFVSGGTNFTIRMQGTSAQTFENFDTIPRLQISNATTVTLTEPFTISTLLTLDAGMGTLDIQGDLTLAQTSLLTIPASATVVVNSGVTLTLSGSLTVAGTLRLEAGSTLRMANGTTLTINNGGTLDINGGSGSAVIIESANSSSTITITANGTVDATYANFNRLTTNGINFNSTVTRFDNINIYSIPSSGRGITVSAGASLPANMYELGFYSGSGGGPFTNIHANAYTGSATTVQTYSGIGGAANETDTGSKINWGTASPPVIQIQNLSTAGVPSATIAQGSAYTHFATFGFSGSATLTPATDITSIKFTIYGTNNNSDITGVRVYKDNGNCIYNAGVDVQVGGTYTTSGTPSSLTATFSSGDINVTDTTAKCVHILLATSSSAAVGNTLGIRIASTLDVVNSQSYSLSNTSGPPVSAGSSTVTGTAAKRWNGGNGTATTIAANWTTSGVPTSAIDCIIGSGYQAPILTTNVSCLNTTLSTGGTINWNNTTWALQVYGALTMGTSYTFTSATNGSITFLGTGNQSVNFNGRTFPGGITVNSATSVVNVESSGTINGNLTLTNGIFRIADGVTFNVGGNITVASGATLDIEPGGTLTLGNGRSITVNGTGILELIGNASDTSKIQAINNTSNYTIAINGNIKAQYYTLANLGATGLTINTGATIDPTYHLQNGTFTYPGANSANLLRLLRQVPTNTMDNMSFGMNGSAATGVINIFTSTTAGTLTIANYSGDRAGATYTNATPYVVSWGTAANELKITQEAVAPASVNQGDVSNMGRWGFQQANAGAYSNTDITSIKVTMTGTATASDVDSASLYYDSACSGSGGTLLGTQSFSGTPASATFSGLSGVTVQAHATTPPKRCVYIIYNINSLAVNGRTIGAKIDATSDVVNSMSYVFNSGFAPPVSLGTSTINGITTQWTGATSTAWALAGNWTSGIPTSAMNCIINDVANDPVISTGTQVCKSVTIGNGRLNFTGGSLEIYGSLSNTGTISGTSNIVIRDNGTTVTSQTIDAGSSTIATLSFNKSAAGAGSVTIANNLTVTNALSIASPNNFTMNVNTNYSLTLNGGLTLSAPNVTLDMKTGSNLLMASGTTLLVNGGTLKASGTNDAYPQSLATKAKFSRAGSSGTWTFSATSGTLNLTGYYFEWLDNNGLNISGTTNVTSLNGGQLRNLSTTSGMRALQLSTTGTLPTTVTNFGWNWGPNNIVPSEASSYWLAYSGGCSSRTVDFDQWFGDFWPYTSSSTAAHTSATSCTILISTAKSPVSLTKFEATPYDSKVILDWVTGNEWDHQGFNVYRSLDPQSGYVQVNNEIIRNDLFSTNIHGTYAFIDSGVTNDTNYYYMLEDISLMGERKLHGPISAKPQLSLGTPPLISAGVISQNGNTPSSGSGNGSVGDVQEISRNILLLSKTKNYLRLKISVPTLNFSNDVTYPTYEHLSIEDYNPTIIEGSPELLARTLMIKVDDVQSPIFNVIEQQKTSYSSKVIAPAPRYIVSGNQLVPDWYVDSSAYSQNQLSPSHVISLGNIVNQSGEKFLPILINPVAYNPVSQVLEKTNEVIVDIFLNGQEPWQNINAINSPWTKEGTVKIGIPETGMYQLSFDELKNAGVIAPLENENISNLKILVKDMEIPIHVLSSDSVFNSGDKIRFYAPHFESDEDRLSYILLFADSEGGGLRESVLNADPSGLDIISVNSFNASKRFEQNNVAVFNEPFTENTDHYVWQLIYGISGGARTTFSADLNLPELDVNENVKLEISMKGKMNQAINPEHHITIKVNNSQDIVAEYSFNSIDLVNPIFTVPGYYFNPGLNKIEIQATGEKLLTGEYDFVYIDSIDVRYKQNFVATNDSIYVNDLSNNKYFSVSGFNDNNLIAYDVSTAGDMFELSGFDIISDGFGGYVANLGILHPAQGRRVWIGNEANFKSISSAKIIYGSDLQNSNNQADVLLIGSQRMLEAYGKVISLRESQGFKVYGAKLEDIYNEFGLGQANVSYVKDFINFARNMWAIKPTHIILLGDGTYDPKGWQNPILEDRVPIKFKMGSSFDYASDSWFATPDGELIPNAVIARIPAQNPEQLFKYAEKVLNYENNQSKPLNNAKISFISDRAHFSGEDFVNPITDILSLDASSNILNPIEHLSRGSLDDNTMKQKIKDTFSESSIVSYMGHGAEDIWADSTVFNSLDVDSMENSKFPVVTAMNCLSGHFYEDSIVSMAEKLVLTPDKGAIAFWGSTSMTPPSAQKFYQSAFFDNLFVNEGKKLGDLTLMAKTQAGLATPHEEVLGSWVVIGDPMVSISVVNKSSEPIREVASSSTGGGGGCFALAAEDPTKSLGLNSFLMEVIFGLLILLSRRIVLRLSK